MPGKKSAKTHLEFNHAMVYARDVERAVQF